MDLKGSFVPNLPLAELFSDVRGQFGLVGGRQIVNRHAAGGQQPLVDHCRRIRRGSVAEFRWGNTGPQLDVKFELHPLFRNDCLKTPKILLVHFRSEMRQ